MHTNYVISLSTATQRREHITQEFGRQQIPFEFFDAVTPATNLDELIQKYLPNLADANLSPGEKSCFMSHYVLWQKCLDADLPYIYIFEDDIVLGENAYTFLAKDEWLDKHFQGINEFVLRFETFLNYSKCKDVGIPPYAERKLLKLVVENCGTAGYVISKGAILKLIEFIKSLSAENLSAIDLIMFNRFNKHTYQMSPGLCVQEGQLGTENTKLASQLQKERDTHHGKKEKRNILDLLHSLINKPKKTYQKIYKDKYIVPFK